MNKSWLQTFDLCRYYQRGIHEVRAIDRVNLSLSQGEFLAVVGSSGSGKSTLMNLIAGLDSPTSGQVEVAGEVLSDLSRRELSAYRAKRIGMVFQSFNLLPHRTAIENVELALYFNHTPRDQRRDLAEAILIRLGLADRMDHKPSDLSGGEQQRVALARALVKKPEILLADEATGNLDKDNTQSIAELLTELNAGGLSIVLVTHDLDLAQQVAERTILMSYGCVVTEDQEGES
ncbi:MAG: ABC transporter ATP-binding protein [candidate division Zixibacteria bacterium]|nr:ABC transporter ATP-binding protein [candidate division Zixibacteria bacterium]